jgi:hypothetical protein
MFLLSDHFEALELTVRLVELQKFLDSILRDQEIDARIILFIVLFLEKLLELDIERFVLKVNVGKV